MSRIIYIQAKYTQGGEVIPPPAPVLPSVKLVSIDTITTITADYGAEVTSDGNTTITARGIHIYTDSGCTTLFRTDPDGDPRVGTYGHRMYALYANTTYWVKAYAVNSVGETLSNVISFTTASAATVPTIVLQTIESISANNATVSCDISSDGGSPVIQSGVCWNTSTNPTTANSKTTDGKMLDTWVSVISGLNSNTTYYLRAYATNGIGTAYSNELNFTTDDWLLLLEFQSNFPPGQVFPMNIVPISGEYKLDLGDGTEIAGSQSSHTYSQTALRTVKLFGKGVCTISRAYLYGCYIVGELNLSNDAFITCVSFEAYTNTGLTNIVLPSIVTGVVQTFGIALTSFSGILDLSAIVNFSTSLRLYLAYSQITGINFANSITGKLSFISGWNCDFTGILDLSRFDGLTNGFFFDFNTNRKLTQIIFPVCSATCTRLVLSKADLATMNLASITNLTSKDSSSILFSDNNMTVSEINKMLVDINSVSVYGFTNRSVYLAGGNAYPDTTSGGNNGIAAAQSLVAKGFILDITV